MPTGYARLAHEVVPGNEAITPTISTKQVYVPGAEIEVNLGEEYLERDDEIRGLSEPLPTIPESFSPTWSVKTRMYPDVLGMSLAAAFGLSATGETGTAQYVATTGNGVITDPDAATIPTGATRHVWTAPFGPTGASPKTAALKVSYKDQGVFFDLRGCATDTIAIDTPDTGGAQLSTSGPAAYGAASASDPSLSPAYETTATRPFMKSGLVLVTWLTGSATAADFNVSITNPVEMVRSMGSATKYPDVVEKGDGLVLLTGSIAKRQLDIDDINALVAATEFTVKARWASDTVIASSYTYKFWVELTAAQYTKGSYDPLAQKRRLGGNFDFRASADGSPSIKLTLVNNVASYA